MFMKINTLEKMKHLANLLILLCKIAPCCLCITLPVAVGSKHSVNRSGVLWLSQEPCKAHSHQSSDTVKN